MSAKKEHTIAVLMRIVITPKDPTTAHVNQNMKGTEIIAQVICFLTWSFCMPSKALLFLFFRSKMIFIAITCQIVDHITSVKILSRMFYNTWNSVPSIFMFCRFEEHQWPALETLLFFLMYFFSYYKLSLPLINMISDINECNAGTVKELDRFVAASSEIQNSVVPLLFSMN